MLKALKTLMKFSNNNLETRRKILSELLRKKDELLEKIRQIDVETENEKRKLQETETEFKGFFLNFLERQKGRKNEIFKQINNMNTLIDKATNDVREAFTELKKYEIVHDKIAEEVRLEELKKQQLEIDEIAMRKSFKN